MNLETRLAALERNLLYEPVILFFADGSTTQINGRQDYLLKLFCDAIHGVRSPEVDMLARSVRTVEPGGGRLLELARVILMGPGKRKSSEPLAESA